jgi:hypothetical protein
LPSGKTRFLHNFLTLQDDGSIPVFGGTS